MLKICARLEVYRFLSTRQLATKVLRLGRTEREKVLASTIVRKDRLGLIKLPKSDSVKAEREASLETDTDIAHSTLDKFQVAKKRLNFRKFTCWLCYKEMSTFGWSLSKLLEFASLYDTLNLRFHRVKE